jgi:hypothetical protein
VCGTSYDKGILLSRAYPLKFESQICIACTVFAVLHQTPTVCYIHDCAIYADDNR